jgi:ribosomal protein RSM22 (predicted rRNA methylase)
MREILIPEKEIVAPCLHQQPCPLSGNSHAKDWCHFFTKPPQNIFHDSSWSNFAKILKIDLRSLPVSYLVAEKNTLTKSHQSAKARMLGRARLQKGCAHICVCRRDKVSTEIVQKKADKEVFALLENGCFRTIF